MDDSLPETLSESPSQQPPISTTNTSLPHPTQDTPALSQPNSPTKSSFNITSILLSSALQMPNPPPAAPRTANGKDTAIGAGKLISTRDPLSIPITTANFRRFVARSGPLHWFQDRVEEVLTWRKGWRVTATWMAAYAFLCFFPRVILLLPHLILIGVLLTVHETRHSGPEDVSPIHVQMQSSEGSTDWFANLQAIQNLMGAYSDLHDAVSPLVPHLTYQTPYTTHVLTFTALSFALLLPLIYILPLRPTFLVLGLAPFALTHPYIAARLPILLTHLSPLFKRARQRAVRVLDDDRMNDKHWSSPLKEVELWENERWSKIGGVGSPTSSIGLAGSGGLAAAGGSWCKSNLRPTERKAWTRGRDGVTDVSRAGEVSTLTFALPPGWLFVETEDWREDLEAGWASGASDHHGWVYTNDMWLNPQPALLEDWVSKGMTRRRRWVRRIYFDQSASQSASSHAQP